MGRGPRRCRARGRLRRKPWVPQERGKRSRSESRRAREFSEVGVAVVTRSSSRVGFVRVMERLRFCKAANVPPGITSKIARRFVTRRVNECQLTLASVTPGAIGMTRMSRWGLPWRPPFASAQRVVDHAPRRPQSRTRAGLMVLGREAEKMAQRPASTTLGTAPSASIAASPPSFSRSSNAPACQSR